MKAYTPRLAVVGIALLILMASATVSVAQTRYTTASLQSLGYFPSYQLNAKVISLRESMVSAEMIGHVDDVLVVEGDQVIANQILAKLDCFSHQNNLKIAQLALQKTQANLDLLNKQLQREARLNRNQNLAQSQIDNRENQIINAEILINEQQTQLALLQNTVNQCNIRAPFAGIIITKFVEKGQTASPSNPAFKLVETANQKLQVMVPQTLVSNLQKGQSPKFIANNREQPVSLQQAMPIVQDNRTQEIRFNLSKPEVVGTQGVLQWLDHRIHLQPQSIRRYQGDLGVYILQNDKPVFKRLLNAQESRAVATTMSTDTQLLLNLDEIDLSAVEVID